MSDEQTLDMPVDRFWMMVRNIPRVRAEASLVSLEVSAAAARGDPKSLAETLSQRMGTVLVIEDQLDRTGLRRLKSLSQGK